MTELLILILIFIIIIRYQKKYNDKEFDMIDKYHKEFDMIDKYYEEQIRRIPEYIENCEGPEIIFPKLKTLDEILNR